MNRVLVAAALLSLSLARPAAADPAADILGKVDHALTAFKDLTVDTTMTVYEPGQSSGREVQFKTVQKQDGRRLVRFTAPGDVKGMGFLIESPDVMYALLPAFGNRVRRLGTHVKGQSFMGSDLGFEDMSTATYAGRYLPKQLPDDGGKYVIELHIKPGLEAEFPTLKMWVDKAMYQPTKISYMDAAGKEQKVETREGYKRDAGPEEHYTPEFVTVVDHRRNDHKTALHLVNSKVDTGVSDDTFSQRNLQRGN